MTNTNEKIVKKRKKRYQPHLNIKRNKVGTSEKDKTLESKRNLPKSTSSEPPPQVIKIVEKANDDHSPSLDVSQQRVRCDRELKQLSHTYRIPSKKK